MTRRRKQNIKLALVCAILGAIVLMTIFAPWLAPYDPLEVNMELRLLDPCRAHPLGTDALGRDVLSRVIYGARVSLEVGIIAVGIGAVCGYLLGLLAGYFERWVDRVIMCVMDILFAFPSILLAMLVVGLWGKGVFNLVIVVGILYTPHFCRIAYSSTRKLRKMEYVESQQLLGASTMRILLKTLLPNIVSSLIIQFSLTVSSGILLESGLSFLGLGVVPPAPSWGQMIGDARAYIALNGQYMFWPSLFLCLTILSTNLMGDALRDVLDPKLKKSF